MRILHTGDWHLGRTLLGADLQDAHAAFLTFLVDTVQDRAVDLVVVAGDVYDRSIPPLPSVRMLSDVLERLGALTRVIVTPGNHDSAIRLGFGASLMRDRVRILADVERLAEPVVIDDPDGPVAVYGIPYLAPDMVRHVLAADPAEPLARSHEAVMRAALDRVRLDLAERGGGGAGGGAGVRSVVVAHAFVGGAEPSDSEQDIRVGGVDRVSESAFDGIDYVALGHLHGPQRVGTGDRIRYAGSPIAFSFGERHQHKSVTIVDLAADGTVSVELLPVPVPRRLVDVRAEMAAIESGAFAADADAWVRVSVSDRVHPDRMFARVREWFPHALSILHKPDGPRETIVARTVSATSDPVEVAGDFVDFATGAPADDADLAILRGAYERALAAMTGER